MPSASPDPAWIRAWLDPKTAFAGLTTSPATSRAEWEALYRRWFTPEFTMTSAQPSARPDAAVRWERARERFMQISAAVATDAAGRLTAALAESGPTAPPITSLRALFELAIDCGDAAWISAAHGEAFAVVLADLLAALGELRRGLGAP